MSQKFYRCIFVDKGDYICFPGARKALIKEMPSKEKANRMSCRPLQPFQSSYVDLSRPCGGDGGVGGQKSLDHPLSAYTHWCSLLGLGDGDEKPKHVSARCKVWKLITPGSLIENWGKQLQRIPLHLQFRQAPTSNLAINLTDFLRSLNSYINFSRFAFKSYCFSLKALGDLV